jgi:hypothetical protein
MKTMRRNLIFVLSLWLLPILSSSVWASPVIDVWQGSYQRFADIGQPQRQVNILGNVTDPNGISSLRYSLNGGPQLSLTLGPSNRRRLQEPGDFNIELMYSQLQAGQNIIILNATNTLGEQASEVITVNYASGNVWPLPYSIDWSSATNIQDVSQIVDGKWGLSSAGIRPVRLGYDRLIAIGDITWDSYEITVPITAHGIDPRCPLNCDSNPGVGVLLRWTGHYDWDGAQPSWGWHPIGALGWFRWNKSDPTINWLNLLGSGGLTEAEHPRNLGSRNSKSMPFGVRHIFKIRAETTGGQHVYSIKMWPEDLPEPAQWDITGAEDLSKPGQGSILLVAHHVDATFGNVTITPLGSDTTPPVISNIQAAVDQTTATVTWSTNEPADSAVAYGTTSAYTSGVVTSSAQVTSHSVTLTGLTPGTLYHYQVRSTDGSTNTASSSNLTFTTASAGGGTGTSPSGLVSDEFSGGALNTSVWGILDPLADSAVSVTANGQLSIAVPAGTTHDLWRNALHAPRVRQAASNTDFQLEVKFDSALTARFQMQGLTVEQDATNLLRFDVYSDGSVNQIYSASFVNGKPTKRIQQTITAGVPLYMRVTRQGDLWTQTYSYDGVNWIGAGSYSHSLNVSSVGVFAGNTGSPAPAHTALIDYFRVDGLAPPAPGDTTPPVISNVQATATETTATITWVSDEVANSVVNYGLTSGYGSTASDAALVINHSVTLTGLTPGTLYHYQLRSTDSSGNTGESSGLTFTTAASPGHPSGLVSDEFSGAGLNTNVWGFLDPVGDSSVAVSDGRLAITAPAGISHDLWTNALFAPRVRQAANNTDFQAEVKFDSAVASRFQLQGLTVEQDAANLLRFDFYSDGSSVRIYSASFVNGVASKRIQKTITAGVPLYMRVTRLGNQWTLAYSYNGTTWLNGGSYSHSLAVTSVGIFAGNAGSPPPAHTALVDYFRVE